MSTAAGLFILESEENNQDNFVIFRNNPKFTFITNSQDNIFQGKIFLASLNCRGNDLKHARRTFHQTELVLAMAQLKVMTSLIDQLVVLIMQYHSLPPVIKFPIILHH